MDVPLLLQHVHCVAGGGPSRAPLMLRCSREDWRRRDVKVDKAAKKFLRHPPLLLSSHSPPPQVYSGRCARCAAHSTGLAEVKPAPATSSPKNFLNTKHCQLHPRWSGWSTSHYHCLLLDIVRDQHRNQRIPPTKWLKAVAESTARRKRGWNFPPQRKSPFTLRLNPCP